MPGQRITPELRNCLAMAYERNKKNFKLMTAIKVEFQQKHPGVAVPHRDTIKNIHKKQMKYFTTHNLNSKTSPGETHSGRPRTVRTPENLEAEKNVLDRDGAKELDDPVASPVSSARKNVLGFGKSSWSRIAQDLKYHPFKMVRTQLLKPQDFNRRMLMCQHLVRLTDQQLLNFCFSDEATFCLDGEVNTQNVRRYAPLKAHHDNGGRPEHFVRRTTNYPAKTMVFLGLKGNGTSFSLKFMDDGKINGDKYFRLIRYTCIPDLKAGNGGSLTDLWWQQDGASPHRTAKNMRYLDGQFQEKVLAMGSISGWDWAARSPDMNPLDFFCWGYVKSQVFTVGGRPQNMGDLRNKITMVVNRLDPDMIKRAVFDVRDRAQKVINANGGYIEKD